MGRVREYMWREIRKKTPWSRRKQWMGHGEKGMFSTYSGSQKLVHNGLVNESSLLPKRKCSQHHSVDFTSSSSWWFWDVERGFGDVIVKGFFFFFYHVSFKRRFMFYVLWFMFLITSQSSAVSDPCSNELNCSHLRCPIPLLMMRNTC